MKSHYAILVGLLLCALGLSGCSEEASTVTPVESSEGAPPSKSAGEKSPESSAKAKTLTPEGAAKLKSTKAPAPQAQTPEVPFEGRRIALVHTANVVGELEPCG